MQQSHRKKRSLVAYQRKIEKVSKWHDRLTKIREKPAAVNSNNKLVAKRRELKSMEEYLSKIKKVTS